MIYRCFFFNDTATTEIYTLSLHDALPISSSKIFIGIFISYLDDVHRLKLLQFARRINKRTQAMATLIFTVFFTLSIMLLAFFSFNTYIDKIMARQNQINNELNDRVSVLTKKLSEISSQLPKP